MYSQIGIIGNPVRKVDVPFILININWINQKHLWIEEKVYPSELAKMSLRYDRYNTSINVNLLFVDPYKSYNWESYGRGPL